MSTRPRTGARARLEERVLWLYIYFTAWHIGFPIHEATKGADSSGT